MWLIHLATDADDSIRWIFEETNGGYYIMSLDGRYLNATYASGNNSGQGDLKLDTTKDVWVLDQGYSLEDGTVDGSKLKSTNASSTASSDKYLGYEESPANLFTVRSDGNADPVTIEEATDPVAVTGVMVAPKEATIEAGRTVQMKATVEPEDATNRNVIWSTNDTSIATVDQNGKVKGISEGTVTITATTEDGGKTDTATVNVTAASFQQTYVITIDGYALSTQASSDRLENSGSGSQRYYYTGLSGVPYEAGDTATDEIKWILEETEGGYYIQSLDGKYLNATYGSNSTGGYSGDLKLDDTPDVWVLEGTLEDWAIDGSTLKSTNASATASSDKYMTHEEGSTSAPLNFFTVRSTGETSSLIDPSVIVETRYLETDSLQDGKEYIIAVTKDDGSVYAVKNANGTSSSNTSSITLDVVPASGTNPAYIKTDDTGVSWTYTSSNQYMTNRSHYLSYESGTYLPRASSSGRAVTYSGGNLRIGTSRYLTCNSGTFNTATSGAGNIRIFVKTQAVITCDHVYGDPAWTWIGNDTAGYTAASAVFTCTKCGDVQSVKATVTEEVTTAATCTEPGTTTYTAKATFEGTEYTDTKAVAVPKLNHTEEALPAVPATCTEPGLKEGTKCSVCGEILVEQTVVPALGHNYGEWVVTTEPTCTATGVETRTCSRCDVTENRDVAALGHDLTEHAAVAAKCEEPGNSAYWSCERKGCGMFFSDAQGTTEVAEGSWIIAALGHDWGEWVETKPATEDEEGLQERTCRNDPTHKETATIPKLDHTHSMVKTEAVPTACETAGNIEYYTCSTCEKLFRDEAGTQEITIEQTVIPATGHTPVIDEAVPAKCEKPGLTEGSHCSVCSEVLVAQTETEPIGHDWDEGVITKPATCTEDGELTHTCKHDPNHFYVEVIDAMGHDWGEGVVTKEPTCDAKGEMIYTCQNDSKHTKIEDIAPLGHEWEYVDIAWTKTASGYAAVANYKCKNDATHNETVDADVTSVTTAATCEEDGSIVYTAAVTAAASLDKTAHQGTQTDVVSATGHDLTAHPAKSVTCTEDGNSAYWSCGTCGKFFSDAEGKHAIKENAWVIPATDHAWGEVECTWSEDYKTATAKRVCGHDATHIQNETVNATSEVTLQPTCETKGKTTYTATFTNEAFETQTETLENIDALGHDWDAAGYSWSEDNKTVTATRTCKRDATHTEIETVNTTSEVTKPATCETKGETTYTAAFTNGAFATQTKTVNDIDVLTHDWDTAGYSWSKDNKTVTATRTCKRDATHTETETVNTKSEVTKPATCETKGETTYTATFTNEAFATQSKTVDDIDALTHDWGAADYTWSDDKSSVTATRTCQNDPSHIQTETAAATYTVTTAATCLEPGVGTWTSVPFDNKAFDVQTTTVVIPATGHSWSDVTYTWAEGNKTVTATRTCTNNTSHVEMETADTTYTVVTPATETAAGLGRWTSDAFANPAFAVQTTDETIPPTGYEVSYNWSGDNSTVTGTAVPYDTASDTITETVSATYKVTTAPTCLTGGAGVWTSDTFNSDKFTVQTKPVQLGALGHDLKAHPAAAETCTTDGNSAYWSCDREGCGKFFSDEEGETEINEGSWIIPQTGHKWGTIEYTWSDDNKTATAKRICENDVNHVDDETVNTTSEVTKQPTCKTMGETTYTAVFNNSAFATQTKTVDDIDALGHDWAFNGFSWTGSDENGYTAVEANYTCRNDSTHVQSVAAEMSKKSTAATCTEAGTVTYTAAISADKALDKEDRTATRVVSGKPMGHTPVTDAAVPATCTESGLTEGSHCSVCGETLVAQEVIPAKGHIAGDPVRENEVAATCTAEGSYDEVVYCTVCKEELNRETKTIDKIAHTPTTDKAVAATCTEDGLTEGSHCDVCGEVIKAQEVVPAEGHDYGEIKLARAAKALKSGLWTRACDKCGHEIEVSFAPVLAKAKVKTSKKAKFSWTKVTGAQRYVIYFSSCGTSKLKYLTKTTKLSYVKKGLKKGTCYKFRVLAQRQIDGEWTTISTSYLIHFVSGNLTKGKTYTNPKSISVSKSNVTLNVGQKTTIKATMKLVKKGKKVIKKNHAPQYRYTTDNMAVAKVNSKGRITAKSAGTCNVYVVGVNGVRKAVKVTVK